MSPQGNSHRFCQNLNQSQLTEIIEQIEETGYHVSPHLMDKDCAIEWQLFVANLVSNNQFQDAKVGKKTIETHRSEIRSDKIFWIEDFSGPTQVLGDWLNPLCQKLKDYFRLPIDFIESHFSFYPEGSFYKKHIDNASGQSDRIFTFIFYLNPSWQTGDGGELILYSPECPENIALRVEPRGGTFVLFRSDLFYHEVLPAKAPRYTFTGWMRRNARV